VLGPRLVAAVAPRAKAVRTTYLPGGSAAALLALDGAVRRLRRGECRRAVVGGVDSWLDRGTLAWLDGARRLKTAEVQDGFIPGEAAAFVVVERAADAARRGRAPYARCSDVFTAREANTIEVDTVCTAQALTDCLRPAVADLRGQGDRANTARTARAVLCDLNGESYRSTEWAYALTRVFGAESPPPPVLLHPADCVGDVGAASGALLLAAAAWAIRRQPARWDASLLWCSSDKGERAACWLGSA
jgi:3-oxoacyl-[acyl-carrier-protein] synthase-1